MEHISIDLNTILSGTLEKDLIDNEAICPVCQGAGVVKANNIYGLIGDTSEVAKKERFPYKHQSLALCPNCYNGVIKLCEFCGKQIKKGYIDKCDCPQYRAKQEEEKRIKYQETIDQAKEIDWSSATDFVYDEKSHRFFNDECEFSEYYWDLYQEDDCDCKNFDEYFDKVIPHVLWNCSEENMHIDADTIVEQACEDLHEDAYDNVSDIIELQNYLDKWCSKQSGTTTYYPCYKEYIKVKRDWF